LGIDRLILIVAQDSKYSLPAMDLKKGAEIGTVVEDGHSPLQAIETEYRGTEADLRDMQNLGRAQELRVCGTLCILTIILHLC
jgi:hypothetical protein